MQRRGTRMHPRRGELGIRCANLEGRAVYWQHAAGSGGAARAGARCGETGRKTSLRGSGDKSMAAVYDPIVFLRRISIDSYGAYLLLRWQSTPGFREGA